MLTRTSAAAPLIATTLTLGAALTLSTLPSLLPRAPLTQGLLTGSCVLLALAVLWCVRRVWTHQAGARPVAAPGRDTARWVVLAGTASAAAGSAWLAQLGLASRATTLAMAVPGPGYWLVASAWALGVIGLGLVLAAGVRRLTRVAWRRTPRPLAAVLLAGVTVTTAAAGPVDVLAPLRKTLDPEHVMLVDSPAGASRSFALADEAESPEEGARLAVDRLVADGGLERGAILIELPTGSGWVNRAAVTAFETQLEGDVAVVSAQYGDLPSWWSFLVDQEPAIRSAEALVEEVLDRVEALPAGERPDVFVHGESLGALAGQEAVAGVDPDAVCGVVWSGAPSGSLSGHPREHSIHNADDPVAYLSAGTVLAPPEGWPMPWLPGLSYATTVLDLAAALDPAPGHGHNYGPEQDWTLPTC